MKKVKNLLLGALVMAGLIGTPLVLAGTTFAAPVDPEQAACEGTGGTWVAASGTTPGSCGSNSTRADLPAIIKTIVNVLLYIIGAVAVIVIVVGAIRFVLSAGNAASVKAAKDTILYAVIGLVVAILAYAIVNFVLKNV